MNRCGYNVLPLTTILQEKAMKIGLRDYFAGLAMQGLVFHQGEDFDPIFTAEGAYDMADAMMKARQPMYPPLESLGFNTRIRNSLAAENIHSVQEIIEKQRELCKIPNIGRRSLQIIANRLGEIGVKLEITTMFSGTIRAINEDNKQV